MELLELQTLYLIRREERTLYYQCVGLANQGFAQWLNVFNSLYQPPNLKLLTPTATIIVIIALFASLSITTCPFSVIPC